MPPLSKQQRDPITAKCRFSKVMVFTIAYLKVRNKCSPLILKCRFKSHCVLFFASTQHKLLKMLAESQDVPSSLRVFYVCIKRFPWCHFLSEDGAEGLITLKTFDEFES